MYVARDVMNQHLDMHDMYDYNAMRRRSDGQGPFDPDDDDDGAPSGFSRQDSLLDAAGRPKSKAASLFTIDTNGTGVRPKNRDELNAMGSNGLRQNRSTGSNKGGAGKGGGGGDGGSSASKSQRKGWSRSSASSKNKGKEAQRSSGDGGKSGKSASGSKSGSGKSNSGRSQKGGGSGNPNDPSGNGPAGGMLNSVANNGQNGGGAPNGSSGNGQNGRRPGSNSGNSQRNGGAGSPNDIRRRDAEDTSGLELQLAKLLLANRNGSGSGGSDPMGPSAGSLLDLHGMPANPPKGPGSAFSLSGVSTSELLQAIQKKTSGNGQRNAMPSNKGAMGNPAGGFNPSSRIPSEAAGLLAAIVASRVR